MGDTSHSSLSITCYCQHKHLTALTVRIVHAGMRPYHLMLSAWSLSRFDRAQAFEMTPNSASAAEIRSPYTVELATDMTTAELHLLQDKARQFENTEWEPTMIADQEDTFSMAIEDLSRGNQADKDLDMRPSKHEPEVSAEEVELRFDTYQTEPTFRVPKVLVEHITNDRAKLTPGYYFYGPYEAGESGPLIFDQDGVSFSTAIWCMGRPWLTRI